MQDVLSNNWSRIVRCLLVIAAWQAPLPFWHTHGTLATVSAESATWLTEHLWTYHAAVHPSSELAFGWHLHFTFPEAEDTSPGMPDPMRQPGVMADGLTAGDCFARLQAPADPCDFPAFLIVPIGSSAGCPHGFCHRPRGFFTDFAAEMPLPVRLGVLRC